MSAIAPDPNEIMEIERQNNKYMQAGDIDSLLEWFADDALQASPGAEMISGKENIRELFAHIAKTDGYELSWEPTAAFVSESNDMAYVYGTTRVKEPSDEVAQPGKYLIVFVKRDGEWRVAIDMANANG